MLHEAGVEYLEWLRTSGVVHAPVSLLASGFPSPLKGLGGDEDEFPAQERPGEETARIRALLAARYGVGEEEVFPTLGTSLGLFLVCAAVLRPGDRVLVESPAYEPLRRVPEAVGAVVTPLVRSPSAKRRLEPDRVRELWTGDVRMVMVSDLHNPTGRAAGDEALRAVAGEAARRGGILFVDEVYRDFREGPVGTARGLGPAVITASSLTKVYGYGGLRAGWVFAPQEVVRRMASIQDVLHGSLPEPSQGLARRVLESAEPLREEARRRAAEGWRVVEECLQEAPGLEIEPPDGGIHAWVPLPAGRTGSEVASALLHDHGVAVTPGRFFGDDTGVRIGLGGDPEALRTGVKALARVVGAG